MKKQKQQPVFVISTLEAGGFQVEVHPRNLDVNPIEGTIYHFGLEAEAHAWMQANFDKFMPGKAAA